jgi:NDP-sugar pyrophosphorylase family protein
MVIICGGLATRLGNLSKTIPKSMIKIGEKPFLEHQIDILKKNSIKDIVLCVGHLSEKIENYFGNGSNFDVNIKYSYDGDKLLGPIGALKNAEPLIEDIFFILYGDSYPSLDFKEIHSNFLKENKLGLMVVYKNYNKYDKSNIQIDNNIVTGYVEENAIFIDYGTSLIRKDALDFVPKNSFFSTGDFFKELIKKHELLAFEAKERFYHIGNPDSLEEFKRFITSK